jgi:hypothetical protein
MVDPREILSTRNRERDRKSVSLNRTLRTQAAALMRNLVSRGVTYARLEYSGAEGQGGFIALAYTDAESSPLSIANDQVNSSLEAICRGTLEERHPNWCQGDGSCGDFRWDIRADSLVHSHYTLGERHERMTHHGL